MAGCRQTRNTSDRIAAHIDVLPTILETCGVPKPKDLKLDGRSILPLLQGKKIAWPDRTIYIQSHRGNVPVLYHNFAARNQRWKLLHNSGFGRENFDGEPKFELYDIAKGPTRLMATLTLAKTTKGPWHVNVSW